MKTIIKNNHDVLRTFYKLAELQSNMMVACLKSGLNLASTIAKNPAGIWAFNYGVGFYNDPRMIFTGSAQEVGEPHYEHVMMLIRGEMVSELFPPAQPLEMVSYWKRHLITDIDVTDTSYNDGKANPAVKSLWVGYTEKGMEIVRVPDGARNNYYDAIARVEYVHIPSRGICVFVVRKDYIDPVKTEKPQVITAATSDTTHPMAMETLPLNISTEEVKK